MSDRERDLELENARLRGENNGLRLALEAVSRGLVASAPQALTWWQVYPYPTYGAGVPLPVIPGTTCGDGIPVGGTVTITGPVSVSGDVNDPFGVRS